MERPRPGKPEPEAASSASETQSLRRLVPAWFQARLVCRVCGGRLVDKGDVAAYDSHGPEVKKLFHAATGFAFACIRVLWQTMCKVSSCAIARHPGCLCCAYELVPARQTTNYSLQAVQTASSPISSRMIRGLLSKG